MRSSWEDVADNESGYEVEMSTADGPFVQIAAPDRNAGRLTVKNLAARTDFVFRVRAVDRRGASGWSVASVQTE